MGHPAGESEKGALRVDFDRRLRLDFHGTRITSDAGLFSEPCGFNGRSARLSRRYGVRPRRRRCPGAPNLLVSPYVHTMALDPRTEGMKTGTERLIISETSLVIVLQPNLPQSY